jgi:hypothetical protein
MTTEDDNLCDGPTQEVFPITWQFQLKIESVVTVIDQRVFLSSDIEAMQAWAADLRARNPDGEYRLVTPHDEGFVTGVCNVAE